MKTWKEATQVTHYYLYSVVFASSKNEDKVLCALGVDLSLPL